MAETWIGTVSGQSSEDRIFDGIHAIAANNRYEALDFLFGDDSKLLQAFALLHPNPIPAPLTVVNTIIPLLSSPRTSTTIYGSTVILYETACACKSQQAMPHAMVAVTLAMDIIVAHVPIGSLRDDLSMLMNFMYSLSHYPPPALAAETAPRTNPSLDISSHTTDSAPVAPIEEDASDDSILTPTISARTVSKLRSSKSPRYLPPEHQLALESMCTTFDVIPTPQKRNGDAETDTDDPSFDPDEEDIY